MKFLLITIIFLLISIKFLLISIKFLIISIKFPLISIKFPLHTSLRLTLLPHSLTSTFLYHQLLQNLHPIIFSRQPSTATSDPQ